MVVRFAVLFFVLAVVVAVFLELGRPFWAVAYFFPAGSGGASPGILADLAPGYGMTVQSDADDIQRDERDGVSVLTVSGRVVNESTALRRPIALRIDLLDGDTRRLDTTVVEFGEETLRPGESLVFETLFRNPARNASGLRFDFVAP